MLLKTILFVILNLIQDLSKKNVFLKKDSDFHQNDVK